MENDRMNRLSMRKADAGDEALLLLWANDPETRANSFNSDPISPETHHLWFAKKLEDTSCDILIFSLDEGVREGLTEGADTCADGGIDNIHSITPAGLVRLEYEGDSALVSYSVDNKYRGRGIGTDILRKASEWAFEAHPSLMTIRGEVKPGNMASRRVLQKAGFAETRDTVNDMVVLLLKRTAREADGGCDA